MRRLADLQQRSLVESASGVGLSPAERAEMADLQAAVAQMKSQAASQAVAAANVTLPFDPSAALGPVTTQIGALEALQAQLQADGDELSANLTAQLATYKECAAEMPDASAAISAATSRLAQVVPVPNAGAMLGSLAAGDLAGTVATGISAAQAQLACARSRTRPGGGGT